MSESVRIQPVTTKKELKEFIHFPWKIYRGKNKIKNWVPPLLVGEKELFDREKNAFFAHAEMENFIAYKNGEPVGRISGIIDHNYVEHLQDDAGFFGFYESINDDEVSNALLATAENWVKKRNKKRMLGPMNPSTNHVLGMLIDSFDMPPVVQMGYNPDYYVTLCDKYGLKKEKDLFCYIMKREWLDLSDKIKRVSEIARKRNNITIRTLNMKKFDEEVELIRELYNNGWNKNWGFVPWTKEEFDQMAEELKLVAIPELVLLAFIDNSLAGISIPLPNINEILIKMNGRLLPFGIFKLLLGKNKTELIRMAILGVRNDCHNKGIDAIFTYETYTRASKMGIKGAEFSWILEDNYPLINLLESWGTRLYRKYRVYKKDLG